MEDVPGKWTNQGSLSAKPSLTVLFLVTRSLASHRARSLIRTAGRRIPKKPGVRSLPVKVLRKTWRV
jgi:hypothetical protein